MRTSVLLTGTLAAAFVAASVLSAPAALAFDVPANDGFVTDVAGVLTPEQDGALETMLKSYRSQTSNEIAVVIIKSLGGEQIEDVALDIGRKWGIGSQGKDNGILMLFSLEERGARIEVGYGLEGAVPDIVARGIIDMEIAPLFRDGKYSDGIVAAVGALQKHIGGEYTADRYAKSEQAAGLSVYGIFVAFLLLQWVLAVLGRSKSWWLGGVFGGIGGLILTFLFTWWLSIPVLVGLGLLLDYAVSRNYQKRGRTSWWAGGGFGPGGGRFGGGGGGFGGFGGGGFGGGGASGRW